jgi:phosphate transport system substrate-binding protein
MNRKIALLLAAALFAACSEKKQQDGGDKLAGRIQISGAFSIYPITVKWAEEFRKIHPDVHFDISLGATGKGMNDVFAGLVDLAMAARPIHPEEIDKGACPFPLVKDAVVLTVNADNPHIEDILRIGLKKSVAINLWDERYESWGQVLGTDSKSPVHVFTRSDACGATETLAAFFGKKQEELKASTAINSDPGLAEAIRKDKLAIGYNNLAAVYDQNTGLPIQGIAVVPLDLNDNGHIDPEEDFYRSTATLIQAIKDGRYPTPPAKDLYLVANGKPIRPEVVAFLRYVHSEEGQRWADEMGYIGMSKETLDAGLDKLK